MADWKDNWKQGKGLGSALGIASGAASLFGSAYSMANPDTDSLEQSVDAQIEAMKQNQQGVQASSLDDLMSQWSSFRLMDTDFDADDYYRGPSDGDIFKNTLSSTVSGAATGASAGPWGALAGAVIGLGSGLIGGLTGKSKAQSAAEKAAADLKAEAERQNAYKQASFATAAQSLTSKNNRMLASQIAAYGGPLGISLLPVGGAIDYMQNEELLSSLGENMTKNNNSRTSMPMFAFGGALPGYGGDWSNGLNFIKAGKRHEQNPIGGVPMGVAQDGVPNLVEEGEVVWNDYVFSNRIGVPKSVREKFQLKGGDNMTFAEAVEKAQKAFAERPNDPIEKRTLDTLLAGLMQEQETIRQEKAQKEQFSQMEDMAAFAADGGPIHIAKNKRGTFTAAATKHGMGVQEFAGHVLANKDKYSPAMVKKANFARNAAKWHALGGHLFALGGEEDPFDFWAMVQRDNEARRANAPLAETPTPREEAILAAGTPEGQQAAYEYWKTTQDPELFRNATTPETTPTPKVEATPAPKGNWESWLRYAPVLGSAVGLGYTLFNQPDHKYANELETAATNYTSSIPHVSYTPLGDYLAYNPFDRLFYANELGAQQAATRRGILNLSNGNRGTALAGLLAADYSGNIGLGKLFREGEEYNLAQRQKVAEFNRGTNMYNSEANLKAQMANAELDKAKASILLDAKMKALGLKQAEDQAWDTSLAANLTGLFDNIGNIGWEAVNRNMINSNLGLYYGMRSDGTLYYKPAYYNLSAEDKAKVDAMGIKATSNKNGGYLTIKNRRRR